MEPSLGVSHSVPSSLGLRSPFQADAEALGGIDFMSYAQMMTTPPRCQKQRPTAVGRLRPLGRAKAVVESDRHSDPALNGARSMEEFHQMSTSSAPSRGCSRGSAKKGFNNSTFSAFSMTDEGEGFDEEGSGTPAKVELMRLRKQLHVRACELQSTRAQVELTKRELQQAQQAHDELRLKHANLERGERMKASQLLEERRKNDELSKKVTKMSESLMGVCTSMETDSENRQSSGLQKECFRLVQKNTELTVKARLLRRQKGWAEAKAHILEDEVTSVYMGTHESLQEGALLNAQLEEEPPVSERAESVYKPILPMNYQHNNVVVDCLSNMTQSQGKDLEGFLQSSRITCEAMRSECLTGSGREFYALSRINRQLPLLLRAVERVIKAENYMQAIGSFAAEIIALLGCASAKMWIVDEFRQCTWTCLRCLSENPQTIIMKLPNSDRPGDLAAKGLVAAAYATRKLVNVNDARNDARFNEEADKGSDGHCKSVLCVPIQDYGSNAGKVKLVFQAIDKLQEPHFDANDAGVLRLLGRVALEVLQVCEAEAAQLSNAKRREELLHILGEAAPCYEPAELLHTLEHSLHKLFSSQHVALHLVVGRELALELQCTALVSAAGVPTGGSRPRKTTRTSRISKIQGDGLRGVVGEVVRSKNHSFLSDSQLNDSQFTTGVDLPVREKQVLYTMPICDSNGCAAVCQFVCPERSRSLLADDKVFHSQDTAHWRLLSTLLEFVHKHLRVFAKADTKRSRESGFGPGVDLQQDSIAEADGFSESGDERE